MGKQNIKKEVTNQDLAKQMASGFNLVARGFKGVTSEIKLSQEELARMVAEGFGAVDKSFQGVATKEDIADLATKAELAEIKRDLEEILLKFDHVPYKFEVKDLQKRVAIIEHKIGFKT